MAPAPSRTSIQLCICFLLSFIGHWSSVAGTPAPKDAPGAAAHVVVNITQAGLQMDHFYYDIPFEDLAIEGFVDGPTAAEMDHDDFKALIDCAVKYADEQRERSHVTPVPAHGWVTRRGSVKIEIEPENPPIFGPLDWGQVYSCLVALESQMYQLQYKESNISIYQIKRIRERSEKIDIGQIFLTILHNDIVNNGLGECAVPSMQLINVA